MYLRNFEIEHMRQKHPCLLNQLAGYGLTPTVDGRGYDASEDIPDAMFYAIRDAVIDAPDTRKKGGNNGK
uniref:Uncharacterized protein n=1 Tax=viral metagenome TaxID=1070528 RepID=A0A6M3IZ25_9ZZZZ